MGFPDSHSAHRRILHWYRRQGRKLPWRRTKHPYRILISEIMLQQTQVSRVLVHYPQFLKKFPDFRCLASASTGSVLRAWRGMGYNNRAVRLRELSKIVVRQYDGKLPASAEELRSLPGIGKYTANAIASFAHGARVPIVETNIARVFSRLNPSESDPWRTAAQMLPKSRADLWNQALMDLGAMICKPSSPDCPHCPLRPICPSAERPLRRKRSPRRPERGRNGIPNRIYRGRIVEILRSRNGNGGIEVRNLQSLVAPGRSSRDKQWFAGVLASLAKDRVVRIIRRSNRSYVSFPQ